MQAPSHDINDIHTSFANGIRGMVHPSSDKSHAGFLQIKGTSGAATDHAVIEAAMHGARAATLEA